MERTFQRRTVRGKTIQHIVEMAEDAA